MKKGRLNKFLRALSWLLIILVIIIFNFPVINTIMTSFKSDAQISASPPLLIFKPTLLNYKRIFSSSYFNFLSFLINSLTIAITTGIITVLVCFPAAYGIARYKVSSQFLFPLTISLRSLPLIIFAVPLYSMYRNLGLIDTQVGLIIIHVIVSIPIAVVLFVSAIQAIPKEIEEAAQIDGASTAQMLLHIVFPLILPSLFVVFLFSFIYSWNEFLFALIFTIRNAVTLTVGSTLFITSWGVQWGNIAAAISLSILPIIIFTFYLQKYLVEALMAGSIKS